MTKTLLLIVVKLTLLFPLLAWASETTIEIPDGAPLAVRDAAKNLCADERLNPAIASAGEASNCPDCAAKKLKESTGLGAVSAATGDLSALAALASSGPEEERMRRDLAFLALFEKRGWAGTFSDQLVSHAMAAAKLAKAKTAAGAIDTKLESYQRERSTFLSQAQSLARIRDGGGTPEDFAAALKRFNSYTESFEQDPASVDKRLQTAKASLASHEQRIEKKLIADPYELSRIERLVRVLREERIPQLSDSLEKAKAFDQAFKGWKTWLASPSGARPPLVGLVPVLEEAESDVESIKSQIEGMIRRKSRAASEIKALEAKLAELQAISQLTKPGEPPLLTQFEAMFAPLVANRPCGLTIAEALALSTYTASGYSELNSGLRLGGEATESMRSFTDVLNAALRKIKPFDGIVNRGADLPSERLAQHQPGAVVTYSGFTSTSVGKGFDYRHRFSIKSKNGRYVGFHSVNPDEYEVLFPPGTKFKILDRQAKGSFIEIVMEEVE